MRSTYRGELVKLAEELVEEFNEFLRRALRRQTREAHDIRKQDTAGKNTREIIRCFLTLHREEKQRHVFTLLKGQYT